MSPEATAELVADLRRRATACRELVAEHFRTGDIVAMLTPHAKASAYDHAAELIEAARDVPDSEDMPCGTYTAVAECTCALCCEFRAFLAVRERK